MLFSHLFFELFLRVSSGFLFPSLNCCEENSLSLDSWWECAELFSVLACDLFSSIHLLLFCSIGTTTRSTTKLDFSTCQPSHKSVTMMNSHAFMAQNAVVAVVDTVMMKIVGSMATIPSARGECDAATSCKARWKLFLKARNAGAPYEKLRRAIFFSLSASLFSTLIHDSSVLLYCLLSTRAAQFKFHLKAV